MRCRSTEVRKSRIRLFSWVFHINVDIPKGEDQSWGVGEDGARCPSSSCVWSNQEMGREGEWRGYGDGEQEEEEFGRKRES